MAEVKICVFLRKNVYRHIWLFQDFYAFILSLYSKYGNGNHVGWRMGQSQIFESRHPKNNSGKWLWMAGGLIWKVSMMMDVKWWLYLPGETKQKFVWISGSPDMQQVWNGSSINKMFL